MKYLNSLRILLLLTIVAGCVSCERNPYSIPSNLILFEYTQGQAEGWDRVWFEAFDESIDDRLVWSVGLISSDGVDDVSIDWADRLFNLTDLSDEDIIEMESLELEFSYSPSGEIEKIQCLFCGGYNPSIALSVTFAKGKVILISLTSRGYPDPAMGETREPKIRIVLGTGESIAIPTSEKTILELFGPWDQERKSSHQ